MGAYFFTDIFFRSIEVYYAMSIQRTQDHNVTIDLSLASIML